MTEAVPVRMLVLGDDAAQAESLQRVLEAQIPGVETQLLIPEWVRSAPEFEAVVIDGRADADGASATARRLRAMGYAGALAMVVPSGAAPDATAPRFEVLVVREDETATALVPALATEMMRLELPGTALMMRARRITAAGEMALRLQHALNNPLAGLMAELQLLQMEGAGGAQEETLARMMSLCRRMVEITRSLDGIGERSAKG